MLDISAIGSELGFGVTSWNRFFDGPVSANLEINSTSPATQASEITMSEA
jgi:hypothetical protein